MSKKLEPEPTTSKVSKEPKTIPDLEQLTESLKHSSGGLPSVEICAQIAGMFSKLVDTHRTYAKAASGIAELSTVLNPSQYTMILRVAVMPTIQIVVPGNLISPVSAPPPPQTAASTALGEVRNRKIHQTSSITRSRFSRAHAGRRKLCNTRFGSSYLFEDRKPIFRRNIVQIGNCNGLQVQHQPAN